MPAPGPATSTSATAATRRRGRLLRRLRRRRRRHWDVGFIYYGIRAQTTSTSPRSTPVSAISGSRPRLWYSSDFAATTRSRHGTTRATLAYELPANFGLEAHIGYSDGDGIEEAYGQDDYFDWSVGVTYALGNFDLGLKYADGSDLETLDGTPDDISSSEGVVIFSVSTDVPVGRRGVIDRSCFGCRLAENDARFPRGGRAFLLPAGLRG